MQRFVLILATAALGLALWQVLEAQSLRDELRAVRQETARLQSDVSTLRRVGVPPDVAADAPSRRLAASDPFAADEATARVPTLASGASSPEVLARAVRDLQERVAHQEERVDEVEDRVEEEAKHGRSVRMPRFFRNVDDAARELDLSPRQREDMERIVTYAKEDLKRLYEIPNAEGKTLDDATKPVEVGGDGNAGLSVLFTNFQAVSAFKNSTVPGRRETYAEAEARIRGDAKREIRSGLDPDQQRIWDDTHTDGLIPGGGGATIAISTASITSSSESR